MKKNSKKNYFYCKDPCSTGDGSGTFIPDCDYCEHNNDCSYCLRAGDVLCRKCIVNDERENNNEVNNSTK